jgi:hypothetical protein
MNSHISDFLDYYLLLKQPEYAVLLKGDWGAGKTWFMENYIKNRRLASEKFIYISLYGVGSIGDIDNIVFQQLHPLLSSKGMRFAGKVASGLLKAGLKVDLKGNDSPELSIDPRFSNLNIPSYITNTAGCIFVFDDLERCKMSLGDIMGYINHLVEHDNYKAIVIANEDELKRVDADSGSSFDYDKIKEKLIGKSFSIVPQVRDVIESSIGSIGDINVRSFLFGIVGYMEQVYELSGTNNLRSVKQALRDFGRIFLKVETEYRANKELLREVMLTGLVLNIEYRSGNITPSDILNLHMAPTYKAMSKKAEEYDSMVRMASKYSDLLRLNQSTPSHLFWKKFIYDGQIDERELNDSIKNSHYYYNEYTPSWRVLWGWYDLSVKDYDSTLTKLEYEWSHYEYKDIGVIMHIVSIFINLSELGVYSKTQDNILESAISYITKLFDDNDLPCDDESIELIHRRFSYMSLGYSSSGSEYFIKFCEVCKGLMLKTKDMQIEDSIDSLMDKMNNATFEFVKLIGKSYEDGGSIVFGEYYSIPIFNIIDPEIFASKLEILETKRFKLVFYGLSYRYELNNIENLKEELSFLKRLKELLELRLIKYHPLMRYTAKLMIEVYLEKSINALQDIANK